MSPGVIFAIGGVTGLAIGGLVSFLIVRKKYKKKMADICAQDAEELSKLKRERDTLKHKTQLLPDSDWEEIQKQVEKGRKKVADETEPEDDILDKTDELNHRMEDRKNYHAIVSKYLQDPDAEDDDPTHGIIRRSAPNGIYEIEESEYRDSQEFSLVDLYFHEMSSDLYTDDEVLIPPDEVPSYVGYSAEQLAVRFLYDDEPSYIYVRNPEHEHIYCVYIAQGMGPQ